MVVGQHLEEDHTKRTFLFYIRWYLSPTVGVIWQFFRKLKVIERINSTFYVSGTGSDGDKHVPIFGKEAFLV